MLSSNRSPLRSTAVSMADYGMESQVYAMNRAAAELAVKAARVRAVAATAGGIETLTADEVRSLVDRPDEKLRRSRLVAGEG